jgi:hypothetical protein
MEHLIRPLKNSRIIRITIKVVAILRSKIACSIKPRILDLFSRFNFLIILEGLSPSSHWREISPQKLSCDPYLMCQSMSFMRRVQSHSVLQIEIFYFFLDKCTDVQYYVIDNTEIIFGSHVMVKVFHCEPLTMNYEPP